MGVWVLIRTLANAPMTVGKLLGGAGLLALGYAVVSLLVFLNQRSLIYFPQPAADSSGRLELQVEGKRVLVAHRPHPGPRALIYFGGNAEDVSLTRPELAALLPDTALFLLHYRGYGGSEGSPSEAALAPTPKPCMPTWPSATAW